MNECIDNIGPSLSMLTPGCPLCYSGQGMAGRLEDLSHLLVVHWGLRIILCSYSELCSIHFPGRDLGCLPCPSLCLDCSSPHVGMDLLLTSPGPPDQPLPSKTASTLPIPTPFSAWYVPIYHLSLTYNRLSPAPPLSPRLCLPPRVGSFPGSPSGQH